MNDIAEHLKPGGVAVPLRGKALKNYIKYFMKKRIK